MEDDSQDSFAHSRAPHIVGNISDTSAKFIALSEISRNFQAYIMPNKFMHAAVVSQSRVATPTPKQVGKVMWNFRRIFAKPVVCKNSGHMLYRERSELVLLLAQERLQEWMAWLLCFEGPVLTMNTVIFILETSRRLPMASSEDFDISAIVNCMLKCYDFSKNQLWSLLSKSQYGHWFSAAWAAKVKRKLTELGPEADRAIPVSWCAFEASGAVLR